MRVCAMAEPGHWEYVKDQTFDRLYPADGVCESLRMFAEAPHLSWYGWAYGAMLLGFAAVTYAGMVALVGVIVAMGVEAARGKAGGEG